MSGRDDSSSSSAAASSSSSSSLQPLTEYEEWLAKPAPKEDEIAGIIRKTNEARKNGERVNSEIAEALHNLGWEVIYNPHSFEYNHRQRESGGKKSLAELYHEREKRQAVLEEVFPQLGIIEDLAEEVGEYTAADSQLQRYKLESRNDPRYTTAEELKKKGMVSEIRYEYEDKLQALKERRTELQRQIDNRRRRWGANRSGWNDDPERQRLHKELNDNRDEEERLKSSKDFRIFRKNDSTLHEMRNGPSRSWTDSTDEYTNDANLDLKIWELQSRLEKLSIEAYDKGLDIKSSRNYDPNNPELVRIQDEQHMLKKEIDALEKRKILAGRSRRENPKEMKEPMSQVQVYGNRIIDTEKVERRMREQSRYLRMIGKGLIKMSTLLAASISDKSLSDDDED